MQLDFQNQLMQKNHFYMDDYIHSLPSIDETIETINKTKNGFHKGGFHLTKFVSNKHEALRFIEQEHQDDLKKINMSPWSEMKYQN